MKKIIAVLSIAAIVAAMMVALALPVFAQGCKAFGQGDVSQHARSNVPFGFNHVRTLAPHTGQLIRSEVGPQGTECF